MNKYITKLVTLLPFKNYSLNEHAQKRQKELQEDFIKQLYNLGGSISFADAFKQKKLLNVTQDELEKVIGAIVLTKEITANEQLELTEKGEQHALKLIRAHRIYEQYLAEQLWIWQPYQNGTKGHIAWSTLYQMKNKVALPLFR